MTSVEGKKIPSSKWEEAKSIFRRASENRDKSIREFMEGAVKVTSGEAQIYWRSLLKNAVERCYAEGRNCPDATYLMKLVLTHEVYGKAVDQEGIPISALIEGRNLPDPTVILREGMTVSKAKAIVRIVERGETITDAAIDQVEKEQRRKREAVRSHKKRGDATAGIRKWKPSESDKLLPNVRADILAYHEALVRLRREGATFEPGDVEATRHQIEGFVRLLEELTPALVAVA